MSRTARLAYPLHVPLEIVPVRVEIIRPAAPGFAAFGIAMVLGFIPFAAMALAYADGHPSSAVFFLAIGVLPVFLGAAIRRRAAQTLVATFTETGVSVVDCRNGYADEWNAEYSSFRGVRLRHDSLPQAVGNLPIEIIELEHHAPDRTIPVVVHKTTPQGEALATFYARRLGLPLLD